MSKDAKDGPVLISLHALLTESDAKLTQKFEIRSKFLSTLSLRRATIPDREPAAGYLISIHALLAESDRCDEHRHRVHRHISIHALLAESDPRCYDHRPHLGYFYPRSPCGERLFTDEGWPNFSEISIHALLAESDKAMYTIWACTNKFLSTLSLRRATVWCP